MNNRLRWFPKLPHNYTALSIEFTISECSEMLKLLAYIKKEKLKDSERQLYDNLISGFNHQLETWKNAINYMVPPPPPSLVPPDPKGLYSDLVDIEMLQQAVKVTVQYERVDGVKINKVIKNRINP
jgi:hypothetical protein